MGITMIVRNRTTKEAKAELSIELIQSRKLKPAYEAVTVSQHLRELNILGSQARASATFQPISKQ